MGFKKEKKQIEAGRFDSSGLSQPRQFIIAIGILCYTLAFTDFLSDGKEYSGKWRWFMDFTKEYLGPHGPAYVYLISGSFLIVRALLGRGRNS